MTSGLNIILMPLLLLLFALWALLLPAELVLAVVKRKRKGLVVLGLILAFVSIPSWLILSPVLLWGFDALRGWELRVPVERPPYQVTLVQEPWDDFYHSYFEVTREDGKTATVVIDADDMRWFNPGVVERGGKTYFVRNLGRIGERTSYVDVENDVIYSGYQQRAHTISELEFE
jgi:hypothetical protein